MICSPKPAVCRETSRRVMGMRHFDVQLIGGMTLHEGRIAEMRTGEGKTLMATLAVYLNALSGKGVHVVTVNEYLATVTPLDEAALRSTGSDCWRYRSPAGSGSQARRLPG